MTIEEGRRARDEAIARVGRHADDAWKADARRKVVEVACANETFVAEAVWDAGLDVPHEGRALGHIITAANKTHLISPSPNFVESARKSKHASPSRIWYSHVFGLDPDDVEFPEPQRKAKTRQRVSPRAIVKQCPHDGETCARDCDRLRLGHCWRLDNETPTTTPDGPERLF